MGVMVMRMWRVRWRGQIPTFRKNPIHLCNKLSYLRTPVTLHAYLKIEKQTETFVLQQSRTLPKAEFIRGPGQQSQSKQFISPLSAFRMNDSPLAPSPLMILVARGGAGWRAHEWSSCAAAPASTASLTSARVGFKVKYRRDLRRNEPHLDDAARACPLWRQSGTTSSAANHVAGI